MPAGDVVTMAEVGHCRGPHDLDEPPTAAVVYLENGMVRGPVARGRMSSVGAVLSPSFRNISASSTGLLAVGSAGSAGSRGHAQIPTSTGSPPYSPATTAAPAGIRLPVVAPRNSVVQVPSARRTPASYMTTAAPDGSTLTSAARRSSSRQPYSATAAASTFEASGPSSKSSAGVATSPRVTPAGGAGMTAPHSPGVLVQFLSVTEIDDELAALPEFAFLNENAEQAGVTGPSPNVERIEPRSDQRAEVRRRPTARGLPSRRRAERAHLGHGDRRARRARTGGRPAGPRPVGLA